MKKIALKINKEDLSVTGDLDKLRFNEDGKSEVVTKNGEVLILTKEEKDNKASYKVTDYKENYDDKNSIEHAKTIKDKLFSKDNGTSKNIIVFHENKVGKLCYAAGKAALSNVINFKIR